MLRTWWIEYWWILPALSYFVLLAVVARYGKWATVGRKILLASICVFILTIPSSPWGHGYPMAVLTVINLLLYIAVENRQAKTSPDRRTGRA